MKCASGLLWGLLLLFACGDDDPIGPTVPISGSYTIIQASIGGTCGFSDEESPPLAAVVSRTGDQIELSIVLLDPLQPFVYRGLLTQGNSFELTLEEVPDDLAFTAAATVEGQFTEDGLVATETFEISDAGALGLDDCTDILSWDGSRRS